MREAAMRRSAMVGALAATEPVEAAGRYKTVTKTFSNQVAIQAPDSSISTRDGVGAPYPSEVSVGGLKKGRVLDVNLQINAYNHTCAEDLDVLLVGPGGRNAIPMSDMPACSNIQGVKLTVDDEGAGSWPVPLVSGTYVPADNDAPGNDAFPAPASGGSAPRGWRPCALCLRRYQPERRLEALRRRRHRGLRRPDRRRLEPDDQGQGQEVDPYFPRGPGLRSWPSLPSPSLQGKNPAHASTGIARGPV